MIRLIAREEKRFEEERVAMEERIERRLRMTNSLNREELLKDVKFVSKNPHEERMKKRKLKKENEVILIHQFFFGEVNRVQAFYNRKKWAEEYNEKKNMNKLKKLVNERENKRDFTAGSKQYKTLEEVFNLRQKIFEKKREKSDKKGLFFVRIQSSPGNNKREESGKRGRSADVKTRNTHLVVGETDLDFDRLEVIDRYYEKEIKERYKHREHSPMMEQDKKVFKMTLEELDQYKLKKAEEVKEWEKSVPQKRDFFFKKRAKTAMEKAIPKFDRKEKLNTNLDKRTGSPM